MADLLTIYYTADTHGYLYPTNFADTQPRMMGLFSMFFPKDGNTLIIDGGDTIQGSPVTYYCYSHNVPLPVAAALNQRGYDYVTLGNHDFNNGYGALERYLHALRAECLCANVKDETGGLPIKSCTVHMLDNGLRVGLVGIVTDWVNLWEKPDNLTNIIVSDPMEAACQAVEELKGRTDLLIGIYHGGLEKDPATGKVLSATAENIACQLCERLPFDLLLTGHQHIAMAGIDYCGTHIVQPPCNATAYCKVTLDENRVLHSQLCDIKAIRPAGRPESILFAKLNNWLDCPVGHLSKAIWPEGKLEMALHGSPIADFFNRVQLEVSGADISCVALGNDIRGFSSAVTVRDVVASYVYSNTLVVLDVTGAVLRHALEQCASYFYVNADGTVAIADHFLIPKEAHYNYDYFAGIKYTFDLNKPAGSRVSRLERNGLPVEDADSMTLCMSSYRATGAGDFDFYQACPRRKEILTEISEMILDFFRIHPFVTIDSQKTYEVLLPDTAADEVSCPNGDATAQHGSWSASEAKG